MAKQQKDKKNQVFRNKDLFQNDQFQWESSGPLGVIPPGSQTEIVPRVKDSHSRNKQSDR